MGAWWFNDDTWDMVKRGIAGLNRTVEPHLKAVSRIIWWYKQDLTKWSYIEQIFVFPHRTSLIKRETLHTSIKKHDPSCSRNPTIVISRHQSSYNRDCSSHLQLSRFSLAKSQLTRFHHAAVEKREQWTGQTKRSSCWYACQRNNYARTNLTAVGWFSDHLISPTEPWHTVGKQMITLPPKKHAYDNIKMFSVFIVNRIQFLYWI